jgi:hypothetical protein
MNDRPNGNSTDRLHPGVYGVMIGLAAVFAIGAWGFADADYTNLVLVVVTGLIATAVAIPLALYLVTWRDGQPGDQSSFKEWMAADFETPQDRVKSSRAMVEILLPIAAVAFGIAVFAIVLHLVPHAAAIS